MILKWLRSSHRMCAARHCPQFATCKQQLTRQHVGGPMNASVFWTVAIPTLSQNIKWRGYFKSQMHGDVGKLKVQPQVSKAIPRAAPSVEVLWPKCSGNRQATQSSNVSRILFQSHNCRLQEKTNFQVLQLRSKLVEWKHSEISLPQFFSHLPKKRNIRLSWHFQVATRCNLQIAVVAKRLSSGILPFSPCSACFNFMFKHS